ncbi:MAG: 5-oxoprolinase subunit PxpA [Pseudomonadota bacterium]
MTLTVDLNADLGELPGEAGRASDLSILRSVTSCAIACGGHAGDAEIMADTLKAAADEGVAAGAHPSYPDREGFGRRSLDISSAELEASLVAQMSELRAIARELRIPVVHVKPHGALYNDASKDREKAEITVRAVRSVFGSSVSVICQPDFALATAVEEYGLTVCAEAFIDRAYRADGTLVPRTEPGAVLETEAQRLKQAMDIVVRQIVPLPEGESIPLRAQTLCIHGDSPGAAATAAAVRNHLEAENVIVRSPAFP